MPGNRVKTPGKHRKDAHLWARDPDDHYVEPRWCDVALFEKLAFAGSIADPSCGFGRVLDAAQDAGYETIARDIKDRGASKRHAFKIADFMNSGEAFNNIVTNPPYLHSDHFARECLRRSDVCALLLRMQWANSGERSRWLERQPLRHVFALSPRPSMPPGGYFKEKTADPSGGQQDYAWYVFDRHYDGAPQFGWVRRPPKPTKQMKLNFSSETVATNHRITA